MKHVTYLQNNEEVLSLRKYRIVVVDILKLNDDSCISKKWTQRGLSLERFSFAFTSNGRLLLVVKARKLSYSSLFLCF